MKSYHLELKENDNFIVADSPYSFNEWYVEFDNVNKFRVFVNGKFVSGSQRNLREAIEFAREKLAGR